MLWAPLFLLFLPCSSCGDSCSYSGACASLCPAHRAIPVLLSSVLVLTSQHTLSTCSLPHIALFLTLRPTLTSSVASCPPPDPG